MDFLQATRVFLRIAELGRYTQTAGQLGLAKASVSAAVQQLEAQLGTRLLQRTTRRQSLTDAGEAYLERVRPLLQDLDEADALVSSRTRELAGVLRVLTPPALATHVLAPLVAGFHERYPLSLIHI